MTTLVTADWETDIEFDTIYGSVARVTDPYHGGSYSVDVPYGHTYGYFNLTAENLLQWNATFYVQWSGTFNAYNLCGAMHGSTIYSYINFYTGQKLCYERGPADIPAIGTHVLSADTWYKITFNVIRHSTNGLFQVYVDDELDISYSGNTVTGYGSGYTYLENFGFSNNSNSGFNLYIDDLVVTDFIPNTLDITFDNMTLAGTGEVPIDGSLSETFADMTLEGFTSTQIMDSVSKRASMLQFMKPFAYVWPIPDGTITAGDRLHLLYMFADIPPENTAALSILFANMLLSGYVMGEEPSFIYGPAWQAG